MSCVQPENWVSRYRCGEFGVSLPTGFVVSWAFSVDLRFSERMIMKHPVVWDVMPCSLAEMY